MTGRYSLPLWFATVALTFTAACGQYRIDASSSGNQNDAGSSADSGVTYYDNNWWLQETDAGFVNACATQAETLQLAPLDLLMVLDVSDSMYFKQKWISVKIALRSFLENSQFDGLGVAFQYFPLRQQCSVDAYENPAVPFGVLPDVASSLLDSLNNQQLSGGTPTVPALEGTVSYAKQWLSDHPTHKAVIVMATDGVPDDTCRWVKTGLANSLENVKTVAHDAATQTPVINTFVIGVGKELAALNEIAEQGGSGSAFLVDSSKDTSQAFLAALSEVRRLAQSCEYPIPTVSMDKPIDYNNVLVRLTPQSGGKRVLFTNVGEKASCDQAPGGGWYYDDPAQPTKVVICPDACSQAVQGQSGRLDMAYACRYDPN